jgi:putative sporulation protein YtaF
MHFVFSILIALSNNLDNISVRIAYSIRGIKISVFMNLWISAITCIFTITAAFAGKELSGFFNAQISAIISMIVLCMIGLWIIFGDSIKTGYKKRQKKWNNLLDILGSPEIADSDNSKRIDFKEATILGIALSLDGVGGGLSAGMIGISPFILGLLSGLVSFFTLLIGNYLAEFFKKWHLGDKVNIIAGLFLIVIGLKQVLF